MFPRAVFWMGFNRLTEKHLYFGNSFERVNMFKFIFIQTDIELFTFGWFPIPRQHFGTCVVFDHCVDRVSHLES